MCQKARNALSISAYSIADLMKYNIERNNNKFISAQGMNEHNFFIQKLSAFKLHVN